MKSKFFCMILVLVMCISLFTACGNTTDNTTDNSAGNSASTSGSAASEGDYVYKPIPKENYTWGTSGSSGTHYIVAAGIASVVNKKASSANYVIQSTAGATENLGLMLSGELDFAYMTSGSVYDGYYKKGDMAKRVSAPQLFKAVMTTHGSTGQMLARVDSGIKSFADLKGKKICTGTTSVEGHTVCEALIATYGFDVKKDMKTVWLEQDEAMDKLSDGDLDAVYLTAGYPIAAFMNLIAGSPGEYTLVQADVPNLQKVVEQMPYLKIVEVPAGTYPGIDFSINALRTAAVVVTPVDTPDAVTYELAKYTYENWDKIQGVHAALKEMDPDELADVPIPLHPGALAFFKSVGAVK